MKKTPHIIWVCPNSKALYRSKGEVRFRPGSVIPKIAEQGIKLNVLIPHDPTLLPKSKLSASRITKHVVRLAQNHPIEIIKLTRGAVSPGIFMMKGPLLEPPLAAALLSKTALVLAAQINRPVDIFHVFGWESALVPLYVELDKENPKLFKETRTFMHVASLYNPGNFAPGILNHIGVPNELFHPEGIEFFGKVSFLKTGLLFSDGVGLIEEPVAARAAHKNGTGLEGVLDAHAYKLRRWPSDRSFRAHMDVYAELMAIRKTRTLLSHLMTKMHSSKDEAKKFIESWGPIPPDRYHVNTISFLMQSPNKAYAFWEWSQSGYADYGLVLENTDTSSRHLMGRNLGQVGDYWVDVEPGQTYVVELAGYDHRGAMRLLLRSQPLRVPRDTPSPNTEATFIDVRNGERFKMKGTALGGRRSTVSSAETAGPFEWLSGRGK